jgi:hypothetical protein
MATKEGLEGDGQACEWIESKDVFKKNKDKYNCDSRAAKCGNVFTFRDPAGDKPPMSGFVKLSCGKSS